MTSYWDSLNRQVGAASESWTRPVNGREPSNGEAMFLLEVAKIEARGQRAVEAVAKLDGFPDDLRTKIARAIERSRTTEALSYRLSVRASELLSDLHSIFHDVASRKINTPFGVLSDDPEGTLKRLNGNGKDAFEDHIAECSDCETLATLGKEAFCDVGNTLEKQWSTVNDLMAEGVPVEGWPK